MADYGIERTGLIWGGGDRGRNAKGDASWKTRGGRKNAQVEVIGGFYEGKRGERFQSFGKKRNIVVWGVKRKSGGKKRFLSARRHYFFRNKKGESGSSTKERAKRCREGPREKHRDVKKECLLCLEDCSLSLLAALRGERNEGQC